MRFSFMKQFSCAKHKAKLKHDADKAGTRAV